jgi:uncharacterized membrane protein YhhN
VLAAAALDPVSAGQRWWFVAGLVLSLAGDIFLMLPRERFVAGLASFLLAHVAYVAGFTVRGVDAGMMVAALVVVAAVASPVAWKIVGALRTAGAMALVAPVLVYMAVIVLMVAGAIGAGAPWGIAGAVLFLASDSLLAWNKFVSALPHGRVLVMVTYHLAQAGLVLSLAT